MTSDADEIRWARRVRQDVIRRLYALDAKGIVDEELIDEAGYAMYARCESIRTATEAHHGRATCPRCREKIAHGLGKAERMLCACGWSATWGEYFKTYQEKQLYGGNAYPAFEEFLERWPEARTPRDQLLLIDALVHRLHEPAGFTIGRPAATRAHGRAPLQSGTARELVAFLDELAYGDLSTPGVASVREEWQNSERVGWMRSGRGG